MNVFAIVVSLAGIGVHAALAIFFYGRLTQKVDDQEKRLTKTENATEQHHGELAVLCDRAGLSR